MLPAFLIVVLFIIGATLSRKIDVSISLALGALAYGLTALGPAKFLTATLSAFNQSMAYVITSLIFAMRWAI
ncbi:hypothetical protein [Pyrobaculum aerophilum]|uniref:hypothetical protein n=1 Tax=Pyrobaculum aerophilum TaxID=13773 RepID=UPI0028689660|nr:hypothetical protein [Pyrobaculum aerophilum]